MARKIVVTGANGLIGTAIMDAAPRFPHLEVVPLSRDALDICESGAADSLLAELRPHAVINCAAFTDIERAESQPEVAERVNCYGVELLSRACLNHKIKLVHIGTHGMFDGTASRPYLESDLPNPLNVYSETKMRSEAIIRRCLPPELRAILRISWPVGKNGNNFFNKIVRSAKQTGRVIVVTDQFANPTPAPWIAAKTLEFIDDFNETLHLTTTGFCSRFELIRFALEKLKISCEIVPTLAANYPTVAKRPVFCAIDSEREDFRRKIGLPTWQSALEEYLDQHGRELCC